MRSILIIVFLTSSFVSRAQVDSLQSVIDNYVIDNGAITYIKVFNLKGLNKSQIKELAIKKLSKTPELSVVQASLSDDQIVGSFSDISLGSNSRRFGFGNKVGLFIVGAINASFVVQFKDERYRVLVSGITSKIPNSFTYNFNSYLIDKDGKFKYLDKESGRNSYFLLGKTIDELFDVQKEIKNQDW